jgi:hypothetical protein
MSIRGRLEKLEAHQSQGRTVMVWWNLNETKAQAFERHRREHPGALDSAQSHVLITWQRTGEGIGASA